jgi:hypothetical protein
MWPSLSRSNLHEVETHANKQDGTSNEPDFVGQQMDCDLEFLNSALDLLPWDNGDYSCLGGEFVKTIDTGGNMTAGKPSPDLGIVQLSQLSSRLVSLHHWSCAVANSAESSLDGSPEGPNSLIDDAAFKSVASWLVNISAEVNLSSCTNTKTSTLEQSLKDDTLANVFTASYQFMETMRGLQDQIAGGAQGPLFNCPGGMSHACGIRISSTSYPTQDVPFPTTQTAGSPSSRIVERHLIMACHTLLLKIYLAVLVTLQCDVDRQSSQAGRGLFDHGAIIHAVSLADIRLVAVVQLCTYILDRQNQVVSGYLALGSPSTRSMQLEPSYFPQHDVTQDPEAGPDLEVQRRLKRLRGSLRI